MSITSSTMSGALDLLRSAKPTETVALITTDVYACGLPANVLVAVPETADQAMEIADTLVRTGVVDVVVLHVDLVKAGAALGYLLAEVEKRPAVAIVLAR